MATVTGEDPMEELQKFFLERASIMKEGEIDSGSNKRRLDEINAAIMNIMNDKTMGAPPKKKRKQNSNKKSDHKIKKDTKMRKESGSKRHTNTHTKSTMNKGTDSRQNELINRRKGQHYYGTESEWEAKNDDNNNKNNNGMTDKEFIDGIMYDQTNKNDTKCPQNTSKNGENLKHKHQ